MGDKVVIDWVVALVAALIGGGLSALGAWFAVGRQIRIQDQRLDEIAVSFFDGLIEDDIERLQRLISFRSSNAGSVAGFELSMLLANYQVFERNREHLFRVGGSKRTATNDSLSRVQALAFAIQNAENDRLDADAKLSGVLSQPERLIEQQRLQKAREKVDQAFKFLPDAIADLQASKTLKISQS